MEKLKTQFINLKVFTVIFLYLLCLFILSGASLRERNWTAVIISVNLQHHLLASQSQFAHPASAFQTAKPLGLPTIYHRYKQHLQFKRAGVHCSL